MRVKTPFVDDELRQLRRNRRPAMSALLVLALSYAWLGQHQGLRRSPGCPLELGPELPASIEQYFLPSKYSLRMYRLAAIGGAISMPCADTSDNSRRPLSPLLSNNCDELRPRPVWPPQLRSGTGVPIPAVSLPETVCAQENCAILGVHPKMMGPTWDQTSARNESRMPAKQRKNLARTCFEMGFVQPSGLLRPSNTSAAH